MLCTPVHKPSLEPTWSTVIAVGQRPSTNTLCWISFFDVSTKSGWGIWEHKQACTFKNASSIVRPRRWFGGSMGSPRDWGKCVWADPVWADTRLVWEAGTGMCVSYVGSQDLRLHIHQQVSTVNLYCCLNCCLFETAGNCQGRRQYDRLARSWNYSPPSWVRRWFPKYTPWLFWDLTNIL